MLTFSQIKQVFCTKLTTLGGKPPLGVGLRNGGFPPPFRLWGKMNIFFENESSFLPEGLYIYEIKNGKKELLQARNVVKSN